MGRRREFSSAVICIYCWNRDNGHLLFPASGTPGKTSVSKTLLASLHFSTLPSPQEEESTVWQIWKQEQPPKQNSSHSFWDLPVWSPLQHRLQDFPLEKETCYFIHRADFTRQVILSHFRVQWQQTITAKFVSHFSSTISFKADILTSICLPSLSISQLIQNLGGEKRDTIFFKFP